MLLFWVVGKLAPLFTLLALGFLAGRRLGVGERLIALVPTRRGAWFMSSNALLHKGLSNAILKRYGFVVPSNLAACR